MNRAKLMFKTLSAMAAALLFVGCTTANDAAPKVSAAGAHPTDWLQTHWAGYAKSPAQCTTCHGSTTDPALAGGISKVSCFTCHAKGPGHPTGWDAGLQHGRSAAMAAPGTKSGFAYCFKCHGSSAGEGLTATTCVACHTKSPHPGKPWSNLDSTKSTHVATNPANATQCVKCHANGANSSIKPTSPAATGTAPGCFNDTLCHSKSI